MPGTATFSPAGHLALSLRQWGVQDHDTHAVVTLESRTAGCLFLTGDATRLRHDLQQAAAMLEAQEHRIAALQDPTAMTQAARWLWHNDRFASLMLGRIEVAQISQSTALGQWCWTLYFCRPDERPSHSAPAAIDAMSAAEAHARKVMGRQVDP